MQLRDEAFLLERGDHGIDFGGERIVLATAPDEMVADLAAIRVRASGGGEKLAASLPQSLQGINERIDLDEVATVYLPLSRLLNLYVSATQDLHRVSATFLGTIAPKVPYIIGIAGSVAVGKDP